MEPNVHLKGVIMEIVSTLNTEIESLLNTVIERHLDEMTNYEIGSDKMSKAINAVEQLHKLRIDEEKIDIERTKLHNEAEELSIKHIENTQKDSFDQVMRDEEMKERRRERFSRIGIAAAEIVLPLTVYTALAILGFAREFDGVITSDTLKRILNNSKPRK